MRWRHLDKTISSNELVTGSNPLGLLRYISANLWDFQKLTYQTTAVKPCPTRKDFLFKVCQLRNSSKRPFVALRHWSKRGGEGLHPS